MFQDLTYIRSGTFKPHTDFFRPKEFFEKVQGKHKAMHLKFSVQAGMPTTLIGDRGRLNYITNKLIKNG